MMRTNGHETAAKYLDKSVIYFFICVFLVSGSALGYRFYNSFPCEQLVMDINARSYRIGELIKFTDLTEHSKNRQWYFGDSTAVSDKREVLHVYTKPGKYVVRLRVNGNCIKETTLVIKDKKVLIDPNKIPNLKVPDSITVGQTLVLTDSTPEAHSWEWRFGETAHANATTQTASYSYESFGLKTITLIVNGDIKHMAKKRIQVYENTVLDEAPIKTIKPKKREIGWDIPYEPVVKEVEKKDEKVPFISEEDFAKALIKVSQEEITEKEFEPYFCGNINKNIVVDGKNMTFLVFCQKIRGKKIKIKRLTLFRNESTNCIENINLEYNRKIL
ncbi:PKD domain-containing protein [Tamlana sp. s12]|uniref:PKD domain-containing protein n=1 Tax=Tamlana sp. s12 TaxID=1630406 RepID=UPI0008016E8B|nr:PKD domain-containing protein [Tamlana sp. s12]OBQ56621.1 hypothetical protein VQ01_04585 [Tamlana sp. s12]QQY81737.1 PKD domain-containing protein [Tamlana sp. s12]